MPVYIKGAGNISPQRTWEGLPFQEPVSHASNRLRCMEPDYTQWIAPIQLRRMSRIIKMGIAAAHIAMKEAGLSQPDAIITGTGFGCLQDTGHFLSQLVESSEEGLNPTPFIQSTHNTIGSQIALLLQDQAYNQTYAHGAFSFESVLLDAMLQLSDDPEKHILAGGIDEITEFTHTIQSRLGIYRREVTDSLSLYKENQKGTLHGEGSAWFVLSGTPEAGCTSIEGLTTLYKPNAVDLEKRVLEFLEDHRVRADEIDLVVLGKSGTSRDDRPLDELAGKHFSSSSIAVYKHLCGEYPVSTAFALWLTYQIVKTQQIPEIILQSNRSRTPQTILIYNQYFGTHHSLLLVKAC